MKFYQGFLGIGAIAAGLIYASMTLIAHFVLSPVMLVAGIGLLSLDVFAGLVWFVNWKYYPES